MLIYASTVTNHNDNNNNDIDVNIVATKILFDSLNKKRNLNNYYIKV